MAPLRRQRPRGQHPPIIKHRRGTGGERGIEGEDRGQGAISIITGT